MWYIYTNEDKMRAFDNALTLLRGALYDYADSNYYDKSKAQNAQKYHDTLRRMFWNELEHNNEVPN